MVSISYKSAANLIKCDAFYKKDLKGIVKCRKVYDFIVNEDWNPKFIPQVEALPGLAEAHLAAHESTNDNLWRYSTIIAIAEDEKYRAIIRMDHSFDFNIFYHLYENRDQDGIESDFKDGNGWNVYSYAQNMIKQHELQDMYTGAYTSVFISYMVHPVLQHKINRPTPQERRDGGVAPHRFNPAHTPAVGHTFTEIYMETMEYRHEFDPITLWVSILPTEYTEPPGQAEPGEVDILFGPSNMYQMDMFWCRDMCVYDKSTRDTWRIDQEQLDKLNSMVGRWRRPQHWEGQAVPDGSQYALVVSITRSIMQLL
jgi:hypothetical protein